MKRIYLALLLASLAVKTSAQPTPELPVDDTEIAAPVTPPTPTPMPLQVQAPTQPLRVYDRVLYVLDVSGSMKEELADAIAVTDIFCSDEFKVAVVTFSSTHARWGGVYVPCRHPKEECDEDCLDPGWAWMPAHRTEMLRYLDSFTGSGGTNPTSALNHAIRNAPTHTLIVFISDGDFPHENSKNAAGEDIAGPLSIVRTAQLWRRHQNFAPVQILVWSTSEADSQRESLVELARLGGGGLWRADTHRSGPW